MIIDARSELVRPAKFAVLIDTSRATVYNMIAAGQLHAVKLGGNGALRIPVSEVERLKAEAISDEAA
jgi:excisionase family DNA binding protein